MPNNKINRLNRSGVSPWMHYTVMLALVISLITTFLLGMLIAETLWGGGLDYFHKLPRTAQLNKAYLQYVQHLYQADSAQAKGAALYLVTVSGTITQVLDPEEQTDGSIRNGSLFTAEYIFNANTRDSDPSPERGRYYEQDKYLFRTRVGDYEFLSPHSEIIIGDYQMYQWDYYKAIGDREPFESNGLVGQGMYVVLSDFTGVILQSDELPLEIDLDDWQERVFGVGFGDPEMTGEGWWAGGNIIDLKIRPISPVDIIE